MADFGYLDRDIEPSMPRRIPGLWNTPRRLSPGRYRVTLEGEVNERGSFRTDDAHTIPAMTVARMAARFEKLRGPAPRWSPGDVVTIRFNGPDSTAYTYVRGIREWPGESVRAKTDAEISRLWDAGKVTPVLQAGGEPFDEKRLP